jgi:hypothetical protein
MKQAIWNGDLLTVKRLLANAADPLKIDPKMLPACPDTPTCNVPLMASAPLIPVPIKMAITSL